jgi:hypothetical protein
LRAVAQRRVEDFDRARRTGRATDIGEVEAHGRPFIEPAPPSPCNGRSLPEPLSHTRQR